MPTRLTNPSCYLCVLHQTERASEKHEPTTYSQVDSQFTAYGVDVGGQKGDAVE